MLNTHTKCKTCESLLDELVEKSTNGLVQCPYCSNIWTIPKKESSPGTVSFLRTGEHELDICKFDDAYSAYEKAAELDKDEPEAYLGMALAQFKVQYLKDEVNNCLQPICHEVTDKNISDDRNYLLACMKATAAQQEEYEKRAKDIDYIQGEFSKLEKAGLDYNCFICVKVTDENGNRTEDSKDADYIYHLLKDKGYKPFYSEYEIRNKQGADYEAHILYALYKSECMLVICRDESYLHTKWVKNEYTRFLKLVNDEEKESDSITFVFNEKAIEKLPGKNGKIQGIDFSRRSADGQIIEFVENHTPEAKRRREEAALAKIREEEERKKRFQRESEELFSIREKVKNLSSSGNATVDSLLTRATQYLNYGDFANAEKYFNLVLDASPENADAWWGLFLCDYSINHEDKLINRLSYDTMKSISNNRNYQSAVKFAPDNSRFIKFRKKVCDFAKGTISRCSEERDANQVQISHLNSENEKLIQESKLLETKKAELEKDISSLNKPKGYIYRSGKIGRCVILTGFLSCVFMLAFYFLSVWSLNKAPWQNLWGNILFFIPECDFKHKILFEAVDGGINFFGILMSACFTVVVMIISAVVFKILYSISNATQKSIKKISDEQLKNYEMKLRNFQSQIDESNSKYESCMSEIKSNSELIKKLNTENTKLSDMNSFYTNFISSNII